jgi:hypothetical protein
MTYSEQQLLNDLDFYIRLLPECIYQQVKRIGFTMDKVIVELRGAEGGAHSKRLLDNISTAYKKAAEKHCL